MNADELQAPEAVLKLLAEEGAIVNLGLERFADTLARLGIAVVQVDWRPPAGGDADLSGMLAVLQGRG